MKQVTRFEAFDGSLFETEVHCRAYESEQAHGRLVGLTADQVAAAIGGNDADLADAIETVGGYIARARRAAGNLKRQRSVKDHVPSYATPVAEQSVTDPISAFVALTDRKAMARRQPAPEVFDVEEHRDGITTVSELLKTPTTSD